MHPHPLTQVPPPHVYHPYYSPHPMIPLPPPSSSLFSPFAPPTSSSGGLSSGPLPANGSGGHPHTAPINSHSTHAPTHTNNVLHSLPTHMFGFPYPAGPPPPWPWASNPSIGPSNAPNLNHIQPSLTMYTTPSAHAAPNDPHSMRNSLQAPSPYSAVTLSLEIFTPIIDPKSSNPFRSIELCATCQLPLTPGDVMLTSTNVVTVSDPLNSLSTYTPNGNTATKAASHSLTAAPSSKPNTDQSNGSIPSTQQQAGMQRVCGPTFYRHLECAQTHHLDQEPDNTRIRGFTSLTPYQQSRVHNRLNQVRSRSYQLSHTTPFSSSHPPVQATLSTIAQTTIPFVPLLPPTIPTSHQTKSLTSLHTLTVPPSAAPLSLIVPPTAPSDSHLVLSSQSSETGTPIGSNQPVIRNRSSTTPSPPQPIPSAPPSPQPKPLSSSNVSARSSSIHEPLNTSTSHRPIFSSPLFKPPELNVNTSTTAHSSPHAPMRFPHLDKVKRTRAKKDPSAPKRPTSNYMFWCTFRRPQLKALQPEVNSNVLMRQMALEWKSMIRTPDVMRRWDELHEMDQARYRRQMEQWRATGSYAPEPDLKSMIPGGDGDEQEHEQDDYDDDHDPDDDDDEVYDQSASTRRASSKPAASSKQRGRPRTSSLKRETVTGGLNSSHSHSDEDELVPPSSGSEYEAVQEEGATGLHPTDHDTHTQTNEITNSSQQSNNTSADRQQHVPSDAEKLTDTLNEGPTSMTHNVAQSRKRGRSFSPTDGNGRIF